MIATPRAGRLSHVLVVRPDFERSVGAEVVTLDEPAVFRPVGTEFNLEGLSSEVHEKK